MPDYDSLDFKIIRINSEERNNSLVDPPEQFVVNFNNSTQLQGVTRIVLKSCSIPYVVYNIKDGPTDHSKTDTFTFNNGTDQTITVAAGNYNIAQLITAITADALAVAEGLAITVNSFTGKLQFTSTNALTYLSAASGNNMARLLGISADSSAVTSFDAQNLPNLSGHPNIYIASKALSDGSHLVSPSLGSLSVFAVIPINVPFGSTIQYESFQEHLDEINYISFANGKSIQSVDLSLYDGDGLLIDMQGLNWTIIIKAYLV